MATIDTLIENYEAITALLKEHGFASMHMFIPVTGIGAKKKTGISFYVSSNMEVSEAGMKRNQLKPQLVELLQCQLTLDLGEPVKFREKMQRKSCLFCFHRNVRFQKPVSVEFYSDKTGSIKPETLKIKLESLYGKDPDFGGMPAQSSASRASPPPSPRQKPLHQKICQQNHREGKGASWGNL